ncbi:MAG: hypothetical protein H3C58_09430 [Fimbriimonadaceae bacterium]|nr:hypothetical protein [Fimbriimonadaceae bacterium]
MIRKGSLAGVLFLLMTAAGLAVQVKPERRPAAKGAVVRFDAGLQKDNPVEIYLTDQAGKLLYRWSTNITNDNHLFLALPNASPGEYRLVFEAAGALSLPLTVQVKDKPYAWGALPWKFGDANGDRIIDQKDLDLIKRLRGVDRNHPAWFWPQELGVRGLTLDFNLDGVVDDKDLAIARRNMGARGPAPPKSADPRKPYGDPRWIGLKLVPPVLDRKPPPSV